MGPSRGLKASFFLLLTLLYLLGCLPAAALTLKLATLAPAGSPWVDSLRRLAAEWERLSGGEVRLKIYAGGIAGEEPDMIRKMRIGQLDGAALSQLGLSLLDPAILALSIPFLIQEEGELDHVMDGTRPYFEARLAAKGYRLLTFSKAGWVHLFGRKPVIFPDDLKPLRLGMPEGDLDFVETWRRVGYNAYSLPLGDLLVGLQAGMIDALYAPPVVAASFQWFGTARHMAELPIAPVVGVVVFSESSLDRIPRELRQPLLQGFHRVETELNRQMAALEREALAAMRNNGLEVHPVPPEAALLWRRMGDRGAEVVIGRSIPRETYQLIRDLLAAYGSPNP